MNRWMVARSIAGSPRCSMIATGVGGTSRIVTSSVVKVFCMSLLLALSSEGRKPRFPVGRLPERRRQLPEPLPKGAGEGVRCIVTGIHRYVGDALGIPVG